MRLLILLHRYLGIGVGLVMPMWCLSGFVMMYVRFPELNTQQRELALEPLSLEDCCAYEAIASSIGVDVVDDFDIEMVAGRPVLRAVMAAGGRQIFDLRSGQKISTLDSASALAVANRFANANGVARAPNTPSIDDGLIEGDQWTIQGQFNHDRPMHRIRLQDDRDSVLYVSSISGEIVQQTDKQQRFWNWLGAVPHWLYPTVLRQHGALWTQVVIWLSLAGAFLTLVGLYLGVMQWRAARDNRWSPYRGVKKWHHISGLIFGVLMLTWVASGLISMNPWGLLEGSSYKPERDRVRDVWIDGRLLTSTLRSLAAHKFNESVIRIEAAPLNGKLFLIEHSSGGTKRIDAVTLNLASIEPAELTLAASSLANGTQQPQLDLLTTGDSYYYSGHERRQLPVYRLELNDSEHTRVYFDATSGDIVGKVGPAERKYRWLFEGLHRWDFNETIRQRPWWDIAVLAMLLGVTLVALTGVYMGYQYLKPARRKRTANN